MKKLLIIVAVLALSVNSFAQVKFGAKAGINITSLNLSDTEVSFDVDSKVGIAIGAFARFNVSDKFVIQPELLYSEKGATVNFEAEEGDYNKSDVKINYLSLPILAKYYVSNGFNLQAGPQVGFFLNGKTYWEDSFRGEIRSETFDLKDGTKKVDFGLVFGLGYDLEMGLGLDVRYGFGLSNMAKDSDDINTKNKGFQITASYAF